ncbi:MAG: glycosyltransferase family 2 protein [Acidobacteria bacterium]|nr:glycosyltransferase family 2 protein [Acidobacteriota bacterium]
MPSSLQSLALDRDLLAVPPPFRPHAVAPALTVVITNYNYARYLGVAIDSVLSQDRTVELVVVDDCSTDNSRDIITAYAGRLKAIFLPVNGGQGAAFNAGFAEATGDLVMFLDADDFLLPGAVASILSNRKPGVSLYLYPMRYSDKSGTLGGVHPARGFSGGDISALLRERGRYDGTITSGMVMDRERMKSFMPMDAASFRYGSDGHIAVAAPLYGVVSPERDLISAYRLHEAQHTSAASGIVAARARWRITHDHARYAVLREHAGRTGLSVAAELGGRDSLHLKERLVSLVYDPAQHPVPSDSVKALLGQLRRVSLAQISGPYRFLRAAWWVLLACLPAGLRRKVLAWEVEPASRPQWFTRAVRALRRKP